MVLADSRTTVRHPAPSAPSPRPVPEATRASGRRTLRLLLFGAALLLAFAGFNVLFEGIFWWFPTAAAVVLPLLTLGIVGHLGRRGWQGPVAGLVVGVVLLTFGFARDRSAFGILPTFDTLARWGELVGDATRSITMQRLPATADEGILFLLAVLAVVSVVAVAPLLDRAPALAALPLLIVLDVPVAVRAGITQPVWFVLVALLYLALLRVGRRRMPVGGIVVTAAVVVTGSLVLPVLFPPAREPVRESTGFGSGINPFIDLGDDLRRDDVIPVLRYTTDAPGGLYLRLATLDEFNGINWEPDAVVDPDNDVTAFPTPPGLDDEVLRVGYTASIEITEANGRWLPVPYPAVSIEGLVGDWRWEPDGLAVRSTGGSLDGQRYDVDYLDIQPDQGQLMTDLTSDIADVYTDLPRQLPPIVEETALAVAGTGTNYERAIALQEFFADGDFQYSLDAPVEDHYDGSGIEVIAHFLEAKSGYCVHFASAMAIMARAVDIPSRVVVGFQPGESQMVDTQRGFVVDSSDLHAWPELYFEGIGWLRFEPTPGRGEAPSYSILGALDDPETPEFEGPNPAATPGAAPTTAPDLPEEPAEGPTTRVPGFAEQYAPALIAGGIGLVVLLLLLTPAGLRTLVRSRRMRAVRSGDAAAAWAEVRDTSHDHDWIAPDTETPRQLSERLSVVVGDSAVASLQRGVEAAAYAPPGTDTMTVEDVDAVRHAIADAAPLGTRLRATFAPPSLLARFGLGGRPPED